MNTKKRFNIKALEISGFRSVFEALRLPFGKERRSETSFFFDQIDNRVKGHYDVNINEKDLNLLSVLVKRGDEHAKAIRGLIVYAEISAPIWFYRELETYKVGRERLSSESTMHIDCAGLSGEELMKTKDEIPSGHIQKTVDWYSYQTLRRIWIQRHNHRLPVWHEFCAWIESLPYAKELILTGLQND